MIRGITLKLGGADYIVPPLNLGALELHGDRIEEFQRGAAGLAGYSIVVDITHAALQRNYPRMTREQVAAGIDAAAAPDVFRAVMEVSGIKRLKDDLGKLMAGR